MTNSAVNLAEVQRTPEVPAKPIAVSDKAPVFQDFDGSFKYQYRPDHFLSVRGFRLEDRDEIINGVDGERSEKDMTVGGEVAGDLRAAEDGKAIDAATKKAREGNTSSELCANGVVFFKNWLLEMSNGGGVMGGQFQMPRMWMIEKGNLNTLLWNEQADDKGPIRSTVNSPNDPTASRINYAFVLSAKDAGEAKDKFPSGVKESMYGQPSFQVEMAGVRFLFLTDDMDKMNAMAMMSKDNKTAANDNQEVTDKEEAA